MGASFTTGPSSPDRVPVDRSTTVGLEQGVPRSSPENGAKEQRDKGPRRGVVEVQDLCHRERGSKKQWTRDD